MWWYGLYKTRNLLVQHSEFLYPSTRVHYQLNFTIYDQCADMPTCLHLMHVAATCGQGTYAPEIFHIRLQEEPTILLYSNNHAEIQTWNIQYKSSRRVYLQSLPPETTKWVYNHNWNTDLKYSRQVCKMSLRTKSSTGEYNTSSEQ